MPPGIQLLNGRGHTKASTAAGRNAQNAGAQERKTTEGMGAPRQTLVIGPGSPEPLPAGDGSGQLVVF